MSCLTSSIWHIIRQRSCRRSLWPAALPTVPFEDNPALGWSDYVQLEGYPAGPCSTGWPHYPSARPAARALRDSQDGERPGDRGCVFAPRSLGPAVVADTRRVRREGRACFDRGRDGNRTAKASRVAVPALSVVAPLSARSGFADPARNLAAHSSEPTNSN